MSDPPDAEPRQDPTHRDGWQPIETAPKDGQFLVYASSVGYQMVMHGHMLTLSRTAPNHLSGRHWSHWMPLPPPPASPRRRRRLTSGVD